MDALKRKLLSLVLICFSSLNCFAQEKPAVLPSQKTETKEEEKYYPKTLEEHFDIFNIKFQETGERNKRLFKDLETQKTISRYVYLGPDGYKWIDDSFYPTEKEWDGIKDYTIDFLEDTGREFRYSLGWLDDIEDEMKDNTKYFFDELLDGSKEDFPWLYFAIDGVNDLFRYGFSFKGKEADGHTHSPTLNEERRLKNRERRERTGIEFVVPEFGRRYIFDMSFGYSIHGWDLKGLSGGLRTEISLKDFQLLDHKFNEAELNFCADQEARFSLTKVIGDNWYYEFCSRFETFPEFDTVSLAFVRETTLERWHNVIKSHPSSLSLGFVYDDGSNRLDKYTCSLNFIERF